MKWRPGVPPSRNHAQLPSLQHTLATYTESTYMYLFLAFNINISKWPPLGATILQPYTAFKFITFPCTISLKTQDVFPSGTKHKNFEMSTRGRHSWHSYTQPSHPYTSTQISQLSSYPNYSKIELCFIPAICIKISKWPPEVRRIVASTTLLASQELLVRHAHPRKFLFVRHLLGETNSLVFEIKRFFLLSSYIIGNDYFKITRKLMSWMFPLMLLLSTRELTWFACRRHHLCPG